MFACQVVITAPNILEKVKVSSLPRAYLTAVKQSSAIWKKNMLRALKCLPVVLPFLYDITLYRSQCDLDIELPLCSKRLPRTIWSEHCLSRMKFFHYRFLLAHKYIICGVAIKRSTIPHCTGEMGPLPTQKFPGEKAFGQYYGALFHNDIGTLPHETGKQRENMMAVAAKDSKIVQLNIY